MGSQPEYAAVVEISDNTNEDRWADAFWRAECAARDAALAAGMREDELTVHRDHRGSVIVSSLDGRKFVVRIATKAAMHAVDLPRIRE